MAVEGVDYSWGRPNLAELHSLGKRFIIRYVSFNRTGKNLTRDEAERATAAGLAIVTNWENAAGDQLGGFARGVTHAKEADRLHKACGGPAGRPIYFSTDFDASTSQLATCYEYLRGAASVIGWTRVGVYGGLRTINFMKGKGVRWLWQTYAWSGGKWASGTHLQQYHNGVRLAGADTDLDRAMQADYGQWMVGKVPPGVEDDVSAKEVWDYNIPPGADIDEYSDDTSWRALSILRSTQTWAYRATKEARKSRAENKAILDAVGGLDTDAILARIDQRAAEDVARDAALMELVEQGQSGQLDAAEVVRLIGAKLTAAAVAEGGA